MFQQALCSLSFLFRFHLQTKTDYSLFKCLGCAGGGLRTGFKGEKSDHPSRRERLQLPQKEECFFTVWLVKSSLFGFSCLHLIPPPIKLSTNIPLLSSFLWANPNLSICSLEQLCLATAFQCFCYVSAFYFTRNKVDIFCGEVVRIITGRPLTHPILDSIFLKTATFLLPLSFF